MPSLPRIITVDPVGSIARLVRAAIDLSEYICRQVDVPSGTEALEELEIGGASLVVASYHLISIRFVDLVAQIKEISPDSVIIVVAEDTDPDMTEEEQDDLGIIYLRRPLEVHSFASAVMAGMLGRNARQAMQKTAPAVVKQLTDMGPVPSIDITRAYAAIDTLLTDLGAMSIVLISRDGQVIVEVGAKGYIKHEKLINALTPSILTMIEMREIVGGNSSTLQFYDGDVYDVYALTVGLHHLLCITYDGEKGQREFGSVSRYGRRTVEDLIAIIGAYAFVVQWAAPVEVDEPPRRTMSMQVVKLDDDEPEEEIARADNLRKSTDTTHKIELDAIPDDLFDASILDDLGDLDFDMDDNDDMFSLDALGEIAKQNQNRFSPNGIDIDQAESQGLLGSDN